MNPARKAKDVAVTRPAETAGGIGGAIAAIGSAFGWDPKVVSGVAVTAAFLPALVTYLVDLKRSIRPSGATESDVEGGA